MQKVIVGETTFAGPGRFSGKLATGKVVAGYYGDIAVLAFKTEKYGGPNVSKGMAAGISGQYPVGAGEGTPKGWVPEESIVDFSANMGIDGTLTWDAPEGEWTIARVGHTSTGKTNVAGPAAGTGLECDKMDPAAVEAHYRAYPGETCWRMRENWWGGRLSGLRLIAMRRGRRIGRGSFGRSFRSGGGMTWFRCWCMRRGGTSWMGRGMM